ncbi:MULTISPECIES: hypothetical protein [unclassified Microbacterium]|uniref:hypothetical protein n=1 Tax=unclassified Microbacterium TaxID=2609290 RepID=UPI0010F6F065|nr:MULTISPECIES: hypothetical protein [unclassified Microbacterium]
MMLSYGMDLDDALDEPLTTADLVAWLPAGSPVWRSFGGPAAISEDQRALQMLDYTVRVVDFHVRKGKGKKPQPPKTPPFAHEQRAEDLKVRRKAEALLRRHRYPA